MAKIEIPHIPEEEKNPIVNLLLDIISQQAEIIQKQASEIQLLKDEIARLKSKPPKPKISPSTMDSSLPRRKSSRKKRNKNKKNKRVKIDKEIKLHPDNLPEDSELKEYKNFFVQDIIISTNNINYRRGKWITPAGKYITARLPEEVNGHFGPTLKTIMLYMNYELNITQPLIHKFLDMIGISISTGKINEILTEKHDSFHQEKEDILKTALACSDFVVSDDTGVRHAGKNGFCTHIGNEFFAYFKSSRRKNRINFLEILRGKNTDFILNNDAYSYLIQNNFSKRIIKKLLKVLEEGKIFINKQEWEEFLRMTGIRNSDNVRIITEAALVASILFHGFNKDLVILSDEAGQFDVFLHALCWIHAERKIRGIVPINDYQKNVIDKLLDKLWTFYRDLQSYQKNPGNTTKRKLENRFDNFCATETEFEVINKALKHLHEIKEGLLLVLKRPEIPLHNNISEHDIRFLAQKRKVHGGTRGESGQKSRDTFLSLMKTCRKLGISFYDYLYDRITNRNEILPLHSIMQIQMQYAYG